VRAAFGPAQPRSCGRVAGCRRFVHGGGLFWALGCTGDSACTLSSWAGCNKLSYVTRRAASTGPDCTLVARRTPPVSRLPRLSLALHSMCTAPMFVQYAACCSQRAGAADAHVRVGPTGSCNACSAVQMLARRSQLRAASPPGSLLIGPCSAGCACLCTRGGMHTTGSPRFGTLSQLRSAHALGQQHSFTSAAPRGEGRHRRPLRPGVAAARALFAARLHAHALFLVQGPRQARPGQAPAPRPGCQLSWPAAGRRSGRAQLQLQYIHRAGPSELMAAQRLPAFRPRAAALAAVPLLSTGAELQL